MGTLLLFIIVLSLLVFVHELGHFVMAKRMGMKVEEFGFGFPPRLWGSEARRDSLFDQLDSARRVREDQGRVGRAGTGLG